MNETVKKRLLAAAVALAAGAGGIATQQAANAPKPSPAVVLAWEIGAHYESGGRHIGKPYVDKIGKGQPWTVCHGVTGKEVDPKRYYTPEDCRRLELPKYLEAERIAKASLKHWASYNVWVQASFIDVAYNVPSALAPDTTLSSPRPWGCFSLRLHSKRHNAVFPTPVGVFLKPCSYHPAQI